MRILQLISSGGMYGIEQMLLTLSRTLQRQGQECVIGVFDNANRHHVEIADQAGAQRLPVVLIPCAGRFDWAAVQELRRVMRSEHVDVLHAHGYKADLYGYMAALGSATATVSTCHNWVEDGIALGLYSSLDRWVLKKFDRTVAVSLKVAHTLRRCGVSDERLQIIANGVDVDRFANADPRPRPEFARHSSALVAFVGRLSPEKAIGNLIHAAASLRCYPDVSYLIVGNGPERQHLERLSSDIGVADRVHFCGEVEDMPGLYATFDILALPSLDEGLPMTILEGLAARKAVVATAVGAIPEVVRHEETGLLVPPGRVDPLAAAIKRLIADHALRCRLGEEGHRLVSERYSAQAMSCKYMGLYEEAVMARHRTH